MITLPLDTAVIVDTVFDTDRRVLLAGEPGVGKSTLIDALTRELAQTARQSVCIGADPGSPLFGVPGAVCLGSRQGDGWTLLRLEALCTLDAARFRLPLILAVARLARQLPAGIVLVDGPGVVRGVAGAELLPAIIEAVGIDTVLLLARRGRPAPLFTEAKTMPVDIYRIDASPTAKRPGKSRRGESRTALWNLHLAHAAPFTLDLAELDIIGTPPPRSAVDAWTGRQIALLQGGQTRVMGEVLSLKGQHLRVTLPRTPGKVRTLLIRDARRRPGGVLETAERPATEPVEYRPGPEVLTPSTGGIESEPELATRVGMLDVVLVNGVFGDPLMHARMRHQRRSLLFDLGDNTRLSTRVAHRVTDVFITHAHADHIAGFLWLLRARIENSPECRMYGPPGLAANIDGLVRGILWDRVNESGPVFKVTELHHDRLLRYRVQAGRPGAERLSEQRADNGILLSESAFRVRAVMLDHVSPVLAFAFEPSEQINVRKDRLDARALVPGPWLGDLKRCIQRNEEDSVITLPDGRTESAGMLAADLLMVTAGKRLVYATDFADTPENRRRLIALAETAHTLVCEATFRQEDAEYAYRTAHLTTRACGEIAVAARVARLIPFHFSRRYQKQPQRVYDEIKSVCRRTGDGPQCIGG